MSASKARVVLNLIRGEDVQSAAEILAGTTREAAGVIAKVLASAVANAVNNDSMNADELYVSAAYADEGITMKRFTPRARGRAAQDPQAFLPHHGDRVAPRRGPSRVAARRAFGPGRRVAFAPRRLLASSQRARAGRAVRAVGGHRPRTRLSTRSIEVDGARGRRAPTRRERRSVGEANEDETVSDDTTEETK